MRLKTFEIFYNTYNNILFHSKGWNQREQKQNILLYSILFVPHTPLIIIFYSLVSVFKKLVRKSILKINNFIWNKKNTTHKLYHQSLQVCIIFPQQHSKVQCFYSNRCCLFWATCQHFINGLITNSVCFPMSFCGLHILPIASTIGVWIILVSLVSKIQIY